MPLVVGASAAGGLALGALIPWGATSGHTRLYHLVEVEVGVFSFAFMAFLIVPIFMGVVLYILVVAAFIVLVAWFVLDLLNRKLRSRGGRQQNHRQALDR